MFKACSIPRPKGARELGDSPVVEGTVNHHPLHLDTKAIILLLHLGIDGVFVLPLFTLIFIAFTSKVYGWGLVHVILALVISEHHLAMQFQLGKKEHLRLAVFVQFYLSGKQNLSIHFECWISSLLFIIYVKAVCVCRPAAQTPRNSANMTCSAILQRIPSRAGRPAELGLGRLLGGRVGVEQGWVAVGLPNARLGSSALSPSKEGTEKEEANKVNFQYT